MTSQRRNVEEIFDAALKIDSATERAAFLNEACGTDLELRRRIDDLLASHFEAGAFLESPVLDTSPTAIMSTPTEKPGTVIGRYKLLQVIGEGGFGVVYMAEQQEPVRRNVALKIIKLGMDTKQVIARFEAERQALAMMDHPNIARVLDAGATEIGRPYFVMELVKGIPITEYCDRNKLSTSERLQLFVHVCRAIQHAHQKGVIHRDVKPSNVLVTLHDSTPVPKVIDFGIAKATSHRLTEKTLFTEFRQFIGTPEYMSPDQAAISGLDVDTRTDIYSLGVLLYELLTGSTPFDPKALREVSYAEILHIIREVEPPRPSARVSTLIHEGANVATCRHTEPAALTKIMRGDLDWIVMKAMEKDRTRRYENASELAADIQRYLNNEPVLARSPTLGYKVRKFHKRHRAGVWAGVAVAVALVIGLSVATYGLLEARRAAARATHEADRSLRIAGFLEDLFISTNPGQALNRQADVETVLTTARDLFGDDHATVAATLSSRALQLQSAGELESAERYYRESLRIWLESEGEGTINVADTYRALGILQTTMGDHPAAEESFRKAITIIRGVGTETLTLAETLTFLADILSNRGEHQQAVVLLREAITIRRTLAPHQKLQLAVTTNALANAMVFAGHNEELPDMLQENLRAWRQAMPADGPLLAQVLTQTALWFLNSDHPDEAEAMLIEALGIFRSVDSPSARFYWIALQGLGTVFERRDDLAGVVPLAAEAVGVGIKLEGAADLEQCTPGGAAFEALLMLANTSWAVAKVPGRSRDEYEAARDGVKHYLGYRPDNPAVTNTLGVVQYRLGNYKDALSSLALSDAYYTEERNGGTPHDVAFIAMAHYQLGQITESEAAMERLYQLMQRSVNSNDAECKALLAEAESLTTVGGAVPNGR